MHSYAGNSVIRVRLSIERLSWSGNASVLRSALVNAFNMKSRNVKCFGVEFTTYVMPSIPDYKLVDGSCRW